MEGANNFVAEELPQMHIPSFLPSQNEAPPRGALLLLLCVMIRFFFSITYPLHFFPSFKKAFQEERGRERANCSSAAFLQFHIPGRKLLATIAFAAAASSSSRARSLTHSLPHSKGN
jgi:hypothetical protein